MGFAEKQVAKYEQPAMMWNVILDPKPEHQNEKKNFRSILLKGK